MVDEGGAAAAIGAGGCEHPATVRINAPDTSSATCALIRDAHVYLSTALPGLAAHRTEIPSEHINV